MKDKKSIFLKIGLVVIGLLVLFGFGRSCVSSKASTNELVVNTSYTFNDDLSYLTLGPNYRTISFYLSNNLEWFEVNGQKFNRIEFSTLNPEPTYRSLSMIFRNTLNSTDVRVCEFVDDGTSVISSNWYAPTFRFITITNSSINSIANINYLYSILTLSDNVNSYYIGYESGYNDGYNQQSQIQYNLGYSDGYNKGVENTITNDYNGSDYTTIYNDGYNNGYSSGESSGYNTGYSEGVESANTYTFRSLISAVIDVPVQTISGLLNWNFLGVNLLDFFLTLCTIALILFILKLLL